MLKEVLASSFLHRRRDFTHSYKTISLANSNTKTIEGLLISNHMKGQEVGSSVYITRSPFYFIRNKALQPSSYLPNLADPECSVPILPGAFVDLGLKQGDILISKDANIGESAYLNEDLPHHMISGGLVRLRFPQDVKYYIFAFMKNDFFRDQIELAPRAATITHAKNLWLNAVIPFPCQQNSNDVIEFVSLLMRALIRKEAEIMRKYDSAIDLINRELMENQQSKDFTYALPSSMEIGETLRLDAGMFCEDYKRKQFHIRNYVKRSQTIFDFGFRLKRGQNLQVTQIGHSTYTDDYEPNFYKLIRPTNLSDCGTVSKYEYLGNPNRLQTLNEGDILFSAEGTIGKFCVFSQVADKTITNIHGIIIYQESSRDELDSVFLGVFLGYLRRVGVLDYLSVGGQGGSLAEKYWDHIRIPIFPESQKETIAELYHKPTYYRASKLNLAQFDSEDIKVTTESGISQLDSQMKLISGILADLLRKIVLNERVEICFDFLASS